MLYQRTTVLVQAGSSLDADWSSGAVTLSRSRDYTVSPVYVTQKDYYRRGDGRSAGLYDQRVEEGKTVKIPDLRYETLSRMEPEPPRAPDLPVHPAQQVRLSFTLPSDLPEGQILELEASLLVDSPYECLVTRNIGQYVIWSFDLDFGGTASFVTDSLFKEFFFLDPNGDGLARQMRLIIKAAVKALAPKLHVTMLAWFVSTTTGWNIPRESARLPVISTGAAVRVSADTIVPLAAVQGLEECA